MTGPARVFHSEKEAMQALKGLSDRSIKPGGVIVLCSRGPMGAGMEEVAQLTLALKHLSWGKEVALDRRPFFGRKHGSLHRARRARSLGRRPDRQACRRGRDPDRNQPDDSRGNDRFRRQGRRSRQSGRRSRILDSRKSHSDLSPDPRMPDDSRLWAALQNAEEEPGEVAFMTR